MLKIGLPGGKSLQEGVLSLFADAGITLMQSERRDTVLFPDYRGLREGIFLKTNRIPLAVEAGFCDIGITGEDVVLESDADVEICTRLSFGRSTSGETRGVLFCAVNDSAQRAKDVPDGATVLSEYPFLTRRFFEGLGKSVEVAYTTGTCEAEVPNRYRFGVALSETGKSLRENGLRPIAELFASATCLVANKQALLSADKGRAIENLQAVLLGILEARGKVLLAVNVPASSVEEVIRYLPALGSPTVAQLADGGSSVSIVTTQAEMNRLVPRLRDLGGTGIIATPIISIIP